MSLIDDLAEHVSEEEMERRKALGLLGAGALAVAMGGSAGVALKYMSPNVLYEPETRFKAGTPDMIAKGSVMFLPRQKVYVVHAEEGFYAMSAVCTHLGCMTRYESERDRIFCPCHGSRFSTRGEVVGGPAPRPLPRLEISIEGGQLIVDKRKIVEKDFILKV